MALIALRELLYGGKVIAEGETFEASPRDTRTLIAVRRAALAPADRKAASAKAGDEPKQTYRTRKMTAGDDD